MRVVVLAFLIAACQKTEGPPCDRVVDHMLELMKQQLTGHDGLQMGNRKLMIDQCEQRKMSPTVRACIVEAKTIDAMGECRARDPSAPTPSAPRPLAPIPGSPGSAH